MELGYHIKYHLLRYGIELVIIQIYSEYNGQSYFRLCNIATDFYHISDGVLTKFTLVRHFSGIEGIHYLLLRILQYVQHDILLKNETRPLHKK